MVHAWMYDSLLIYCRHDASQQKACSFFAKCFFLQNGSLHAFACKLALKAARAFRKLAGHATTGNNVASQRSLHYAPIFRLLLKVAVNGTHQCDFLNFCGASVPTNCHKLCFEHRGLEEEAVQVLNLSSGCLVLNPNRASSPHVLISNTKVFRPNLNRVILRVCS